MPRTRSAALAALALSALSTPAWADTTWLKLGQGERLGTAPEDADLSDFSDTDGWQESVLFEAGTLPLVMGSVNLPPRMAASAEDCGVHTCTSWLTLRFEVPAEMAGRPARLVVTRWGSEYDVVMLDGAQIGGMAGAEMGHMRSRFELGALSAGTHTVGIWLTGAGNIGDGDHQRHFVDLIKITTTD